MLTQEQTAELVELAKTGDDLAKEKLITLNSPLIKSVVKRYLNKGIEYDDLYQLGALGFVKAINNFDASFNVKFTTYAVPMIAGEIKRFLRDDGSVKVSRSIKHTAIQIKNYIAEYNKKYGENPSLEILSKQFNMDISDIVFAMEANKLALREMIKNLTSREKQVIIMRYYLDKTQSEIAKELGVSQVQVSRIENKVLNELKEGIDL